MCFLTKWSAFCLDKLQYFVQKEGYFDPIKSPQNAIDCHFGKFLLISLSPLLRGTIIPIRKKF